MEKSSESKAERNIDEFRYNEANYQMKFYPLKSYEPLKKRIGGKNSKKLPEINYQISHKKRMHLSELFDFADKE